MKKFFIILSVVAILSISCSKIEQPEVSNQNPPIEEVLSKASFNSVVGSLWSVKAGLELTIHPYTDSWEGFWYNANLYFVDDCTVAFYYSIENGERVTDNIYFSYRIDGTNIYFGDNKYADVLEIVHDLSYNNRSMKEGYFGYYHDLNGTDCSRPAFCAGLCCVEADGTIIAPFAYSENHKALIYNYFERATYKYCD